MIFRSLYRRIKQWERRSWFKNIGAALDHIGSMMINSRYNGANPAIAAAYSPMRLSLLFMFALFILLFVLGLAVPIDSASVANGSIVVISNKKTVQHLEGGIIREILVKDGDAVKAGQTLIVLNDVAPKANQSMNQQDLYAAQVTEARLLSLRNKEDMQIPQIVLEQAANNPEIAKTIATQKYLYETQKEAHSGKIKTLRQHIEQSNEEIVGLRAQVRSIDGQLALVEEEIAPIQRLVEKNFVAKPQLLALQRKKTELYGNRGQYIAGIAKARQSITEMELQIENAENEFAKQIADELRDIQTNKNDSEEKLRAASDVVQRTAITAPYEGIVTGLKYHTIGGVITAGAPIMDIVPQTDRLIVEAQVSPADIDVVEVGLETKIVFSAYKARSLPRLTGKVTSISADVFYTQQGTHTASYYTARVEVDHAQLEQLENKVKLYPGMPVEVFINTGQRSFLGYLFAPITSSLQRAFRED